MKKQNLRNSVLNSAIKDERWLSEAKFRKNNKSWLDFSFEIAIKIGAILESNGISGKEPNSQKQLAVRMNCTAQYVNKILRGKENLTLETIVKIEEALGSISLIETSNSFNPKDSSMEITEIEIPRTNILFYQGYFDHYLSKDNFSFSEKFELAQNYIGLDTDNEEEVDNIFMEAA